VIGIAPFEPKDESHAVLKAFDFCIWAIPQSWTADRADSNSLNVKMGEKTCTGILVGL
jgi:hypothetical protein